MDHRDMFVEAHVSWCAGFRMLLGPGARFSKTPETFWASHFEFIGI